MEIKNSMISLFMALILCFSAVPALAVVDTPGCDFAGEYEENDEFEFNGVLMEVKDIDMADGRIDLKFLESGIMHVMDVGDVVERDGISVKLVDLDGAAGTTTNERATLCFNALGAESSPVIENNIGVLEYVSTDTSNICDFVSGTGCTVYTAEYKYQDKPARIVAGVEVHPASFTNQQAIDGIMGEFGRSGYTSQKETYEGNNIYLFTGGQYPNQQILAAWYSGKNVVAIYVDNSPAVLTDAEVDDVFEDSLVKYYLAKYPSSLKFEGAQEYPQVISKYLQDITTISGNREVYAPKEKILLTVTGIKTADGSPAASSEGWNVQYYTYNVNNPDTYLQEYVPTGNYNANFDGTRWKADYWAPSKEGSYYTEIVLYCSRQNSECWNAYGGHGLEVREKIYFTVKGEAAEPEEEATCTAMGYKCTSAIRGCGHYAEKPYSCGDDSIVCCADIPRCGDGVCFQHDTPGYGETAENCPQDCGEEAEKPEMECVDTDGGLDYYTKGKGKGLYSNSLTKGVIWGEDPNKISARWDNSLGYSIHYDVCVDSETSNQLNEAYCDANGILQSRGYNCPYGCKDGACIRGPEGEGKPDLVIKNLKFVRKSSDLSTIEFDIYNIGTAPLQNKFAIALYIDGRLYDHSLYEGYLGQGGMSHKELGNYYWLGSGNAQHTITVVADRFVASQEDNPIFDEGFYDNMIDESNEYNNKVEITIGEGYEVPVTATRGYTLADYPEMFISGNRFNGYVVVGDNAPASDVISATDISAGIQYSGATTSTTGTVVSKIEVGAVKLASEIGNPKLMNLISVGNSCNNAATSELKGNPEPCNKGLSKGEGVIRLYEYGTSWQVVVEGYSDEDVRKAARVLANYNDYPLSGTCMLVGGDFSNPKVKGCDDSYYEIPITVEPVMYRSTFWINNREKTERMVDGIMHAFAVSDVDMYMQTGKCAVNVDGTTSWIDKGDTKTINGVKIMLNDYKLEALGSTQTMRSCLITVFGKSDVEEVPYGEEAPEEVEVVLPEVVPVDSSGRCVGGCLVDHSCLSYGIRFLDDNEVPSYCDIRGMITAQKEDEAVCQNNYECLSNTCGNGKCQDFGERLESLEQEVRETRGIVGRILEWLGRWFGGK